MKSRPESFSQLAYDKDFLYGTNYEVEAIYEKIENIKTVGALVSYIEANS